MTAYPEHYKMQLVADDAQVIGEFLDTTRFFLTAWDETTGQYEPVRLSVEEVLASHFGIDLVKIEAEKRAMLASAREANGA